MVKKKVFFFLFVYNNLYSKKDGSMSQIQNVIVWV